MNQLHSLGKLYARPSFIEGAARNIDILNVLREYNESRTAEEADNEAMKSDWYAVGDDLKSSISTYERKNTKPA